jgi:Tfp pilus assembly protein PilZ
VKERSMKILFARFESAEDFLRHYDPVLEWGGIVVPTRAALPPSTPVVVEVAFPGLPNRVLVRGLVVDRDEERGGLTVKLANSELQKRNFLVAAARGDVGLAWRRRHRRFPLRLKAGFRHAAPDAGGPSEAQTEDLSGSGIFLRTPQVLSVRTPVVVIIDPADGKGPIEVPGRVAWVRRAPPTSGFGVCFDSLSGEPMKRLRRVMRDLKGSGRILEIQETSAEPDPLSGSGTGSRGTPDTGSTPSTGRRK